MLYLVCTPIGNLADMTYRAVETLRKASLILAEDTRHTALLLHAYEIRTPMLSYQKFNERARCAEVIERLRGGEEIALVTDAGTPCISDPGAVLVREAIAAGLPYTLVGSSCAFVSAAVLSGFDVRTLAFGGFLPEKAGAREKFFRSFLGFEGCIAFYLSPHDLHDELASLYAAFGAREAVLVREISKKFEECVRFVLGDTPAFTEKGEYVLVLAPSSAIDPRASLSVREHVASYIAQGIPKKDAVKRTARDRDLPKSEVYRETLDL